MGKNLFCLFAILIFTSGCSTVERDPNANWVRDWNGLGLSLETQKYMQEHRLSGIEVDEYLIRKAEKNNYLRYSRELVGLVDKEASSTWISPLGAEVMYFKVASGWLDIWQSALEQEKRKDGYYGCPLRNGGCTLPELRAEKEKAKEHANIFARKLLELPQRHLMSYLVISRIFELSGSDLPEHVKQRIPAGMKRWEFIRNPSSSAKVFFLNTFKKEAKATAIEMRGGGIATLGRAIASGMLIGAKGFRYDNELIPKELYDTIGLRVIGEHEVIDIPGLYQNSFVHQCEGLSTDSCGEEYIKVENGWKETY